MSSVARAWDRFWFAPQATSTLALVRMAFGVLTIVWTLTLVPDAGAFFDGGGLVAGHAAAPFVLLGLLFGAVAVTIGLWTRFACATVLFCLVWLHRVDPLVWNTGDVLLRHIALFLALAPAGDALSVDRWRRGPNRLWEFPRRAPWALRLIQVQVALMYFVTVLIKLQGSTWREGTAVSYILRIPEDARFAVPASLVASSLWAEALTFGTLAVEAAIPLLVWNRTLRPYVLGLGVCLHIAIEVMLRTGLFSWIVLASYLAFVPPPTAARFLHRFRRRRVSQETARSSRKTGHRTTRDIRKWGRYTPRGGYVRSVAGSRCEAGRCGCGRRRRHSVGEARGAPWTGAARVGVSQRMGIALLALTLVATPACDSPADRSDRRAADGAEVLVGELEGGKGLIAVVHDPHGLVVYACGFEENLNTHTGWFFGTPVMAAEDERSIPKLVSAGGLAVEGRIRRGAASGTLQLTSGAVVQWQAERAQRGAGLYGRDNALARMGLIVANDGRTAGNAVIAPTDDSGSPQSVPVTTSGSPPSSSSEPVPVNSPTTTAASTTSTTARSTTSPTLATLTTRSASLTGLTTTTTPRSTTQLAPVKSPSTMTVTKESPAVVFLVHGMSDSVTTPGAGAIEDTAKCEGPRNTPFYSRCEWGIDFIPGIFGTDRTVDGTLSNLAGADVSGGRYLNDPANRPEIDETMGLPLGQNGCPTGTSDQERVDPRVAQHFVTTARSQAEQPPRLAVFTTWRDSTRGLVESGRRVARQVYAALRWYESEYKITPAVYFVGQSFGGLASRFLLSNPTTTSLEGLNPDRIVICPSDRAKMNHLRDRTVHLTTLATPHEGSYMAELGEPPKEFLRSALEGMRGAAGTNALTVAVRSLEPTFPQREQFLAFFGAVQIEIEKLLRLLDTPALRDLELSTVAAFNRGPLAPDRAKRTPSSPIAGAAGALIPVYATLSRSPGSNSFDSPSIRLDTYIRETPKEQGWITSTMFLSDIPVKLFIAGGFGRVNAEPYVNHARLLDRRARLFDVTDTVLTIKEKVADAAKDVSDDLDPFFVGTFGGGLDGIITYLSHPSVGDPILAHGAIVPISVDRVWRIGLSGTATVPAPVLSCGGQSILLDYGPLLQALYQAFTKTPAMLAAIGGGTLPGVVEAAGGTVQNGAPLVTEAIDWFRARAAQLQNVPPECQLPTGQLSVTDFLRIGNVANWRVTRGTTNVPVPAWEPTNTPVQDGEMDNDGPVHSASALGFTLGTQTGKFFEHDRQDGPPLNNQPTFGSWYRLGDNPVTERYNHGQQYQNDVGQWLRTRLLRADVGPVPRPDRDSVWP